MVWDGGYNVRDLGGLPTRDGRRTRPGAFFRSASTRFMSADGWQQARDAGVRTVVDLRRDDELAQDPTSTADAARAAGLVVTGVDLTGPEDDPVWDLLDGRALGATPLLFEPCLAAMPDRVVAVMTALARTPEGGVVFHCQAGRDRTGLVSLVLLALAGVDHDAIVEDYERSGPLLTPVFAMIGRPDQQPEIAAVLSEHGTTAREVLTGILDGFDAQEYLLAGGMHAGDVEALRARLLG